MLIEAARWLGVAPWELEEHLEWLPYVLITRKLVAEAEERAMERASRRANRR